MAGKILRRVEERLRLSSIMSLRGAERRGNLKQMNNQYYIYILTNMTHSVLYIGVTNDLKRRIYEHKEKLIEGFTKRYNVDKLVYYEVGENIVGAISREKQLKDGSRLKKIRLIESMNAEWRDLYEDL